MSADTALRVARAICPRETRERRFEEWRADTAGCEELGLSTTGVVVGALRLATAARARFLLSRVALMLLRTWTVAVGVVFGAACAVCGIPVLVVVSLALLLQGTALAVTGWRSRRRIHSRRVEVSG